MYDKVLVPLDGSSVAEVVLPHVEELSVSCAGEVILFRVIPPPQGVYDEMGREIISDDAAIASATGLAKDYLEQIGESLKKKGVKSVKHEVRIGHPAEAIIDYAKEIHASLIAMATHGRSGVSRWVYGSVAERVLRGASTPILLIRATSANVS